MDAVSDQVNWSAVAARAFREKLVEINSRKGTHMSKKDIVKRLQAAKKLDAESDYEEGRAAGKVWAAEKGTPKELRRVANFVDAADRGNVDWWDVDYPGWNAPFGAVDNFAMSIDPTLRQSRAFDDFWEELLGDDKGRISEADFLHGFGDGVTEVWEEVKDEL